MDRELSEAEVRELYLKVLRRKSFIFEFDSDKDIVFQIKNIDMKFMILIDPRHLEFVRICCPNFYKVNPVEELKIYKACNAANIQTKIAKVYVSSSKKTVWCAYENVVRRLDEKIIEHSLDTALVSIHMGIKNFIDALETTQ